MNLPQNNIDLEEVFWKQKLNKQLRDSNLHRMLVEPNYTGPYGTVLFANGMSYRIVTEDFKKIQLDGYFSKNLY